MMNPYQKRPKATIQEIKRRNSNVPG
jgi:hypothetical protein